MLLSLRVSRYRREKRSPCCLGDVSAYRPVGRLLKKCYLCPRPMSSGKSGSFRSRASRYTGCGSTAFAANSARGLESLAWKPHHRPPPNPSCALFFPSSRGPALRCILASQFLVSCALRSRSSGRARWFWLSSAVTAGDYLSPAAWLGPGKLPSRPWCARLWKKPDSGSKSPACSASTKPQPTSRAYSRSSKPRPLAN